jgi:outer membrane protein assembly factor BamA
MQTMPGSSKANRFGGWLMLAAACLAPAAAPAAAPPSTENTQARVGQIFIIGNERTRQNVILSQVPLSPGQVLSYPALREAERNLRRLDIFECSPDGSVRPTVTLLDNPVDPDSLYKDILITVQETETGSLTFGLDGSLVIEERNFDLLHVPCCFEDLLSGGAFRGAGQKLRLELKPIPPFLTVTFVPGPRSRPVVPGPL